MATTEPKPGDLAVSLEQFEEQLAFAFDAGYRIGLRHGESRSRLEHDHQQVARGARREALDRVIEESGRKPDARISPWPTVGTAFSWVPKATITCERLGQKEQRGCEIHQQTTMAATHRLRIQMGDWSADAPVCPDCALVMLRQFGIAFDRGTQLHQTTLES